MPLKIALVALVVVVLGTAGWFGWQQWGEDDAGGGRRIAAVNHGTYLGAGDRDIRTGGRLETPGGEYELVVQDDGNVVEYDEKGTVVWATGTGKGPDIVRLTMQPDCNLVGYATGGIPVWESGTDGAASDCTLRLQEDGNLVVVAPGNIPVWQR